MRPTSRTTLGLIAALAASASLALSTAPAVAFGDRTGTHPKSGEYRGRTEVRGYSQGVGGYSYTYTDGLIDSRDTSVFLDPELSTPDQTELFDGGFFFDSGINDLSGVNSTPYPQ